MYGIIFKAWVSKCAAEIYAFVISIFQNVINDLYEPVLDEEKLSKLIGEVVDYLVIMFGKDGWNPKQWTFMYYATAFLNLLNVALQFFLTDYMLDHEFRYYGLEVNTHSLAVDVTCNFVSMLVPSFRCLNLCWVTAKSMPWQKCSLEKWGVLFPNTEGLAIEMRNSFSAFCHTTHSFN